MLKSCDPAPENTAQSTRVLRDRSTLKPPVQFGFHHYYEPNTFESAIRCADEKFWKEAIEKEVLSIENHKVWFNVQGAFLHAPLTEDVYIKTPKGVNRNAPYLKLKKALYGLKQSPKNWYKTLASWLESVGFHESNCDPYLYLGDDGVSCLFFHVDDLVLA
ncbi:reverse transcriptase [Puccinia sorghi]|uniref:Reverse transcriptase n=1 Tax=Puccinia sorghi TaxID=27349 RepID=A0A0L6U9S6_9BASI|nr:reverse transcriptase [Puccinia sorghi]